MLYYAEIRYLSLSYCSLFFTIKVLAFLFASFTLSLTFSFPFAAAMSSKKILLFGVPLLVGCCAILWMCWDYAKKRHVKKGRRRRPIDDKKENCFIPRGDWRLAVFAFLAPSQLGLEIALLSHRFDCLVDEHFKTRKWAFDSMDIWRKIGENGTKEVLIVNSHGKALPIPQKPMPKKIIGFKCITIEYFHQNVVSFLHRFRSLFGSSGINLSIGFGSLTDRTAEYLMCKLWPLLRGKVCGMEFWPAEFRCLRQFAPYILRDCPSLRTVCLPYCSHFDESDGQAVSKWLLSPRPDGLPKVFRFEFDLAEMRWVSLIREFKASFANASRHVNFIIVIRFSCADDSAVATFDLINNFTGERSTLKRLNKDNSDDNNNDRFLLIRCPISRDECKWSKWEKEAIGWEFDNQWNRIIFSIKDYGIDHCCYPGPSGHQNKSK